MQVDDTLVTLLGSRICHDLISPIGAINNGLELLEMAGGPSGPEIALMRESVQNASARIRFFRIAFGAAGDQNIGAGEITDILSDLFGTGRLALQWSPEAPQPRSALRLAFLAILCLESALPYGGEITVSQEGDCWTFAGTAERTKPDPAHWQLLEGAGNLADLPPAQIQFALLPLLTRDLGGTLSHRADPLEITLRLPG